MKKNTRFAFNAYLQQLARLNGVAVEELSSKFTVEPSVQQTLEDQIQQSAAFLTLINVTPVTEQSGQLLGLGVGSTIAGTTDTTAKEREPVDPTLMVDVEYKCEQTNFDTVLTYAKLDLWAKFQDFQVRIRNTIVKRQALDRIMIGFNGVKRAKTSNRSENLIRTGVVTEVDRENWLCRVKTGELETNWISWLTLRAGNARTWWRPSEGEQVVLLSLGGNLETAFALPAIYSNQFAPPSTSADACVTEHPDGGWFEYEPATGRWYVRGIKSMVIEAADNITLKTSEFVLEADRTRINSEVVINGGVTQGGGAMSSNGIVVDAHQHTGVLKGGDTTGGPV